MHTPTVQKDGPPKGRVAVLHQNHPLAVPVVVTTARVNCGVLLGSPEKVMGVMVDAWQVGATQQGGMCVQRLKDLSSSVLRAVVALLQRFVVGQDAMLGDPGKAAPVMLDRRIAALRTDRIEALEAALWQRHGRQRSPKPPWVKDSLGGGFDNGGSVKDGCHIWPAEVLQQNLSWLPLIPDWKIKKTEKKQQFTETRNLPKPAASN